MKKTTYLIISIILITFSFIGCQASDENRDITAVINKNFEAMNSENLDEYMSTISEDSPAFDMTEQLISELFAAYDLDCKIEKIEVIEVNEDVAKVEVVQITKKISGPQFQDNQTVAIHTLKKKDGAWKIVGSEIKEFKLLDEE